MRPMLSAKRQALVPRCGTLLPHALCIFHLTRSACAVADSAASVTAMAVMASFLPTFINGSSFYSGFFWFG
jgi:hypothetical protein